MTEILTDIIFDEQKQLATDIYLPQGNAKTKILLFWHGGGWFRGDKSNLKELCLMAADRGFLVFAPNYSLAPQATFPAAHQDSINFVKWLLSSEYVTKGTQISQIGVSSGGTLALLVAGKYSFPTVTWSAPVSFSNWMQDHPTVKPSPQAHKDFGTEDLNEINDSFYKYFTLTYAGSPKMSTLKLIDAASYDYHNLQQLLMINSTNELAPTKYLLAFINFLASQNLGVELKLIPGKRHAMAYASEYIDFSLAYLENSLMNNQQ